MDLIRILENEDWIVDYDKELNRYRVSYFQDDHFVDDICFDGYKEKNKASLEEVSNSILQTLNSARIKPYSQKEKLEAERVLRNENV